MKRTYRWAAALCLALMACLVVPALAPANINGAGAALAASRAKLNKTKATIYNGETLKLKVSGASGKVAWRSSDAAVAKVSAKGVVTAKGVGKATITAAVGGRKLTCAVTVKSPLAASDAKVSLKAGNSRKVTLTYRLSGKLTVKCDDASVVKCSLGKLKNGKCTLTLKGLRAGEANVTISNSKTKDVAVIKVTVKGGGSGHASIVDKTEVALAKGKSATVKVTWPYAGVPDLTWDDATVVDCKFGDWNGSGWPLTIKGIGAGESTLTFRKGAGGETVATIKVTVK